MNVRKATVADAADLARLQTESWRAAYSRLIPADALEMLHQAPRAERWAQLLADPASPATVLISTAADGSAGGFTVFGDTRDGDATGVVLEIVLLGAGSSTSRQGHGRALVQAVVEHAMARHATEITLWVVQANKTACAFLESQGFRTDASQRLDMRLTSLPLTEVRYRQALNPAG